MLTAIINGGSTKELKAAFAEANKHGYSWAQISNAGLPEGKWRLTFVPGEAVNIRTSRKQGWLPEW